MAGLSVSTKMTVGTRDNVVIVPANAVMRGQNGFYAYLLTPDGKAEARNLKISLMNQSEAVIMTASRLATRW